MLNFNPLKELFIQNKRHFARRLNPPDLKFWAAKSETLKETTAFFNNPQKKARHRVVEGETVIPFTDRKTLNEAWPKKRPHKYLALSGMRVKIETLQNNWPLEHASQMGGKSVVAGMDLTGETTYRGPNVIYRKATPDGPTQ